MGMKIEILTFLVAVIGGFVASKTGANLFWSFIVVILLNAVLKMAFHEFWKRYRLRKSVEAFREALEKKGA